MAEESAATAVLGAAGWAGGAAGMVDSEAKADGVVASAAAAVAAQSICLIMHPPGEIVIR
ncbi:hypothetical protein GCM10022221_56590 [Actinocorallia aurea]